MPNYFGYDMTAEDVDGPQTPSPPLPTYRWPQPSPKDHSNTSTPPRNTSRADGTNPTTIQTTPAFSISTPPIT